MTAYRPVYRCIESAQAEAWFAVNLQRFWGEKELFQVFSVHAAKSLKWANYVLYCLPFLRVKDAELWARAEQQKHIGVARVIHRLQRANQLCWKTLGVDFE